jgi:hypothetical protein
MTDYLYKSTTGRAFRVKQHSVTVDPGLLFDQPVAELDELIGTKLARYLVRQHRAVQRFPLHIQ